MDGGSGVSSPSGRPAQDLNVTAGPGEAGGRSGATPDDGEG